MYLSIRISALELYKKRKYKYKLFSFFYYKVLYYREITKVLYYKKIMKLKNIDYHIIDKCNLNCASCNHYAPLAKESNVITPKKAEHDFTILKKFDNKFMKLTLLGGEALINPYIEDILKLSIKYFPNRIKLITNGICEQQLFNLKETIDKNNVELVITEYPFKENFREYYDNLKESFHDAIYYTYRHEHGFISEHLSYDTQNTDKETLLNCEKRFKCCQYINGKLYICHYAGFLEYLNTITTLNFTNDDSYIDLTKCTNDEFDKFFKQHIPNICTHCMFVRKSYDDLEKKPWHKSEKSSVEWII